MSVRVDKRITVALNVPGARLKSAGKTTDEIVQMWNEDHLNDMIVPATEPEPNPD